MRGPWDVAGYPAGVTALATYSILPGSLTPGPSGRGDRPPGLDRPAVAMLTAVSAKYSPGVVGTLDRAVSRTAGRSHSFHARRSDGPPEPRFAKIRAQDSGASIWQRIAVTLRDEILEQPEVAARFLARAPEVVGPLVESIQAHDVDHVVIAARGTSDHAAIYAQYVLGVRHALSVGLGTPSVISLYGAQPRLDRSLVVGISQSGASPDVVAVVEAGRRQGAPTLAITNDPTSPLALAAETSYRPRRRARSSRSPRRRRTRPSCWRSPSLSAALTGDSEDTAALAAIPDAMAGALALEPDVESMARDQAAADRLLVLARGFEYATAREWALKLKELARVFADPYSAADFEHGPLALLEPGVPVLATVRPGPTEGPLVALLERLRDELDAAIAVVSDRPSALGLARWPFAIPQGTPEWLGPIVSIVIGQLHALHLTHARGLDPERPRNLNKVTRTR